MAKRQIRISTDEVLRKICKPVKEITPNTLTLLDDMAETMYDANGVGLAAPQVGVLKRIVVIDIGDGLVELINPVIVEATGSQIDYEGCLSVPGASARVDRPASVKVEAPNRDGEKIIVASVFIAVFNIFAWTHGYRMISGNRISDLKKIVLNPGVIGLVIGMPLFILKLDLPEIILTPIQSFSALNTPLAMVIIGCNVARVTIRDFFADKKVFEVTFLRLIFVPIVFFAVAALFMPEAALFTSCVIQASAPVAANTVLFANKFKADEKLASRIVAVTTLISIVTMPFFVLASKTVGAGFGNI